MSDRVAVVLGTRPEIIKLAGVIRGLGDRCMLIHSGQHYDEELSEVFFTTYGLAAPAHWLKDVGGFGRGAQFAAIIGQLTEVFAQDRPSAVVVQGDTNTAAAAAQAASFLDIPVVHVEAGLRSRDRAMPEEINRQIVGVVAELHCAPTIASARNLINEGVPSERISVTGNTVVEATLQMLPSDEQISRFLSAQDLVTGGFVLATIHRPENTDDVERLSTILSALASVGLPVVLPLHPRTKSAVERFGLSPLLELLDVREPVNHRTFLAYAKGARLIVSDSGGIQEEATVIKRPLVVLRNSTERPESIDAGFARLLTPSATLGAELRAAVNDTAWHRQLATVDSPYGDGTASEQILRAVDTLVSA